MIHRNQKHIDAVDVSEEVMCSVFDHRHDKAPCIKRGEKLVAEQKRLIRELEDFYSEQCRGDSDDEGLFDEHGNKKTDGMEHFGDPME